MGRKKDLISLYEEQIANYENILEIYNQKISLLESIIVDYEKKNACQEEIIASYGSHKKSITLKQWRWLIGISHPDKHNNSSISTDVTAWLTSVKPHSG